MKNRSNILKYALFATGVAGIVAEYILSTLASYFLGDSVFQWTIIVSTMLFSMGIGSRISKYIDTHLLEKFIFMEFALSILTSFSAIIVYYISAFTDVKWLFIYSLAILIGTLIGMEIPLVTRLNNQFEELKVNIANVLEKDYYGSLLGGLFFAFVGLPLLGLTYTPFILGGINLIVAILLFFKLRDLIQRWDLQIRIMALAVTALIVLGAVFAEPILMFGEQAKFKDKVVYSEQSRYQKIVMTEWRGDHWLYLNGNQQLSTVDEFMYHEPLVHPAVLLTEPPVKRVAIFGGGDGCAARELLKYDMIEEIIVVDLDPAMTDLARTHPVLTGLNGNALDDPRVSVINQDAFIFIEQDTTVFDLIITDLPDPKSVDIGRLYSVEFYRMCRDHLRPGGIFVTQAGSPYFAANAFLCIKRTLEAAGFSTLPMHNQVLTMGQWGWLAASMEMTSAKMEQKLLGVPKIPVETVWLNADALEHITSFGRPVFADTSYVAINTLLEPVLYRYYSSGYWDLY